MAALFVMICALIGGYVILTNQSRLRQIAAAYLGSLVGGQVRIEGSAELRLFEGLRLEKVSLIVPDGDGPQSTLVKADTVVIGCSLRDLLSGHLEARQIILADPQVNLAEDAVSGRWNYDLLGQTTWPSHVTTGGPMAPIPDVLLRNAQVDYFEVKDGQSSRTGWMAVDGHFGSMNLPNLPGQYEFRFQSRGDQGLGPTISGIMDAGAGHISASLPKVIFGRDTQAMLPSAVGRWCREHNLTGQASVTMSYDLGPRKFSVETQLDGVAISIPTRAGAPPLTLRNARGELIFKNKGIDAQSVTLELENNTFFVDGALGGYFPNAVMNCTVRSVGEMNIAENLPSAASLPPVAMDLYKHFHPAGRGTAVVHLRRAADLGPLECTAQIDVTDGAFTFADLPYPARHATGQILIGHDETRGFDVLRLVNLHAHGPDGSPNEKADLLINGWMGPFDSTTGGVIQISGRDIHNDPALPASFPAPVRRALAWLDANHEGFGSRLAASFTAQAVREQAGRAEHLPWIISTDINLAGAQATCTGFPYRLDGIAAQIQIRNGYVNVVGLQGHHGSATVHADGRIDFDREGKHYSPDLHLAVENVAIDSSLLAALPPSPRELLHRIGVAGRMDVNGRISGPWPSYDLDLAISKGSLSPGGVEVAGDFSGHIRATPGRVESAGLSGGRGDAGISAGGWLDWSGPRLAGLATVDATNVLLDDALCKMLPPSGRNAWAQLQPSGTADVEFKYDGASDTGPIELTIRPRQLSATPRLLTASQPLHLQNISGWLTVNPGRLAKWDITARDRRGRLAMNGSWKLDDPAAPCDLRLSASDMSADTDLIQSLPPGLSQIIQSLRLTGAVGFEFSKLSYRQIAEASPGPTTRAADGGPDVDFAVKLNCDKSALFIGVPLDDVQGWAMLNGSVRNGALRDLSGEIQAQSLLIAGRHAANLKATILKPPDESRLYVKDLNAEVAGGNVAGELAVDLSNTGASRYAIRLAINGADARELTGLDADLPDGKAPADTKLISRISASLDLAGSVNDPASRRGRGNMVVGGGTMYQLPLVLGLFEITNLSLPINSPFQRASASYSVQGQRVTLEQILVSGRDVAIQGGGHLDFKTMQVDLNLTTSNSRWLNVPVVGQIWNGAQNELMRIHVKGSLHAPQVSATPLDTFSTTVDEVFRGK
jgi:hypothetical protein